MAIWFSFNVPTQEVVDLFQPADERKNTAIRYWVEFSRYWATLARIWTYWILQQEIYRSKGDLNTEMQTHQLNNYRAIRLADVYHGGRGLT
jgi:hypothetical protein